MSESYSVSRTDPMVVWASALAVLGGIVAIVPMPEIATVALSSLCIGGGGSAFILELLKR